MAVYWVPLYIPMPVIWENSIMEDNKGGASHPELALTAENTYNSQAGLAHAGTSKQDFQSEIQSSDMNTFNSSQVDNLQPSPSTFDMRSVSNALPDQGYRPYSHTQPQMQYGTSPSYNPGYIYNYQGNQFSNQVPAGYNMNFQQMSQNHNQARAYPSAQLSSPGAAGQLPHIPNAMFYPQQPVSSSHGMVQGGVYGPNNYPANPSQFTRMGSGYHVPQLRVENFQTGTGPNNLQYSPFESSMSHKSASPSSAQSPSALRGPPRKPKQSGHALWVGNLPPGTHIIDLKDHFSRDATDDIESVFLISKSNCAFVNYKTEQSCSAAMTRFHDSRFQGVRLVCRLRRGSSSATMPSPNPASAATDRATSTLMLTTDESKQEPSLSKDVGLQKLETSAEEESQEKTVKEKYFIVKSLTVEDLERSVASGIWATQSHNEDSLNQAFKAAENVYLIFSANKSGEYFGYARMDQYISEENEAENSSRNIEPVEKEHIVNPPRPPVPTADVPLTIPTPATATAPKGRIIDDSARGTIFWEAAVDETTLQPEVSASSVELEETSGDEIGRRPSADVIAQQSSFGKPFKITWLSTDSLPFYRTRGLRNPWNANREVKIARDGTELEPSVGRRLIGMFSQQAQINASAAQGLSQQQQQFTMSQQHQHPQMPYGNMSTAYGYGPQAHNNPYGRPY